MAYEVLARKYRSVGFDDLVGQEAIARTLKNAITSGRIAHGYLFCGTRGVGKTSSARILAKALNCLSAEGPTPTPCGTCDSCLRIHAGDDVDCIEIDAASNTGVDNVRDLRANANYRPARARFKIYIIDEVHMLSTAAFNAMLKTLEEPPPHVKFILATTDPHKVPITVRSRVQRFDFRPIKADDVARHFRDLIQKENAERPAADQIHADEAALRRVARLASGSMRDGLSLLDQLLTRGEGRLTEALLDELLPGQATEAVTQIVSAIANGDAKSALESADRALADGSSVEQLATGLVEHFHALMVMGACGPQTDLVEASAEVRERLAQQSKSFDAQACVYIVSMLEEIRRAARFDQVRPAFDAALVRLADAGKFADLQRLLQAVSALGGAAATEPPSKK